MTEDKKLPKLWQTGYFWKSITPLLVTLLAVGLINYFSTGPEAPGVTQTPTRPTAVAQQAASLSTPTRQPILPATILPSPTPSRTPLPTLPHTARITLLGPPVESVVSAKDSFVFYWRYSEEVLPGQQFVITLWQDDIVIMEAFLPGPNMGDVYQVSIDFAGLEFVSGTAVWQVHLEWVNSQTALLSSEIRTIIFLADS